MADPGNLVQVLGGRYEVLRRLGRGGMGAVYECRDLETGDLHAVKLLQEELLGTEQGRRDFRRECKALQALEHPHILGVTAVGTHEALPYLVTELCVDAAGRPFTLAQLARQAPRRRLAVEDLNRIFAQVLSAMAFLHTRGLVHRDVKPQNVFLNHTASGWDAKVADFGLIALTGEQEFLRKTRLSLSLTMRESEHNGALVGTFDYMSPEQKQGRLLDARSDVFSLGLMLYRLATGRSRITFQLPCEIRPELPAWVDEAVRRSVDSDPDKRVRHAGELLALLPPEAALAVEAPLAEFMELAAGEPAPPAAPEPPPPPSRDEANAGSAEPHAIPVDASAPARPPTRPRTLPRRAAVLAAMLVLTLMLATKLLALRRELWLYDYAHETVRERIEKLDRLSTQLRAEQEATEQALDKYDQVRAVLRERRRWPELLTEIEGLMPEGIWLVKLQPVTGTNAAPSQHLVKGAGNGHARRVTAVTLTGHTAIGLAASSSGDRLPVETLLERLRASPLFQSDPSTTKVLSYVPPREIRNLDSFEIRAALTTPIPLDG